MRSSVFAAMALIAMSSVIWGCSAGAQGESVGSAQAAEESGPGQGAEAMFTKLDVNKDGKLTLDEVRSEAAARFAAADTNKDGVLDAAEMQAMHTKGGGKEGFFAKLDTNGDGSISRDEAPARMQEHFDQLDTNKDGKIDSAELEAGRQRMMAQGEHQKRDPKQMIARFDKDGNGTLSREEVPERMREHFDQIDTNKNGQLEAEELAAAHEKMRGAMGPDADHDGKVTLADFSERAAKMFQMADANHDGVVTLDEMRAMRHPRKGGH